MTNWIKDLDRILRGEATRLAALRGETIDIRARGLAVVVFVLAVIYGLCMGCYAVFQPDGPVYMQLLASSVKVPALFFLTLVVTFPSLYVFNALVGSRLNLLALFRLLVAALAVNLAVLASLGPIVAFFSLSTTSYPFMVLLNVLVCGVSGILGLAFLLQTLHRMTVAPRSPPPMPSRPGDGAARRCRGGGDPRPSDRGTGGLGTAGRARARQAGQGRVQLLGGDLRTGRRPDGLDPEAVHRRTGHAVRVVPGAAVEFLRIGVPHPAGPLRVSRP